MKHINTGKVEILLVKEPEGNQRVKYEIVYNEEENQCDLRCINLDDGNYDSICQLEKGRFTLLDSAWELTEEQWKEILNEDAIDLYKTAGIGIVDAGIYMLKAFSVYQVNPYKDPCHHKISCFDNCQGCCWNSLDYTVEEFEEAEANTGNWIVLIKIKE